MASSLSVWADVLKEVGARGLRNASPGIHRKTRSVQGQSWEFRKEKATAYYRSMSRQTTWSIAFSSLLTPHSPLLTQMHECLNVPLPLHCMPRLTPFIRVIRGLEGGQWRGSTVWHSRAMVTIQLAASIFAPPPHDLHQWVLLTINLCKVMASLAFAADASNMLIGWRHVRLMAWVEGVAPAIFSSEIGFSVTAVENQWGFISEYTKAHSNYCSRIPFSLKVTSVPSMNIVIYLAAAVLLS